MASFATRALIGAPVDRVWRVLADVGTIHEWNPGVKDSYLTTAQKTGVGAARHCDLAGGRFLEESVAEFDEGRRITMRVDESNLPLMRDIQIRFDLEPGPAGTQVICSPSYSLRYGPIGLLADRLMLRTTYRRGMEALLGGLKKHVEAAGRPASA